MKNKKSLIAIICAILITVIGATFAYFTTSMSFENLFNVGTYKLITTEIFESPDNWMPGEEIPKTIVTKNEGTIPAAVRVSYTEQWLDSDNNDITNSISPGTIIINFDNTDDWTYDDGYYYYNYILNPDDITSSFIKSVTLNSSLGEVTCTGSGLTRVCESSNPALGATYKLTLTKETVQADKYQDIWNIDLVFNQRSLIQIPSNRTKDTLQVGDEICIYRSSIECFNFIKYDNDNIVMLAKYNLNVGDKAKGEETFLQDSTVLGYDASNTTYGEVAFAETSYWYDDVNSILKSKYGSSWNTNNIYDPDYDTEPDFTNNGYATSGYSIAYYIKEYKDILEGYGVEVEDARLLTYAEATDQSIGCDVSDESCPANSFIANTSFWLGSVHDCTTGVWNVISAGPTFSDEDYFFDQAFGVRPVIVIDKNIIE